jgi:hypothetical protein
MGNRWLSEKEARRRTAQGLAAVDAVNSEPFCHVEIIPIPLWVVNSETPYLKDF